METRRDLFLTSLHAFRGRGAVFMPISFAALVPLIGHEAAQGLVAITLMRSTSIPTGDLVRDPLTRTRRFRRARAFLSSRQTDHPFMPCLQGL